MNEVLCIHTKLAQIIEAAFLVSLQPHRLFLDFCLQVVFSHGGTAGKLQIPCYFLCRINAAPNLPTR